GHGLFRLPKSVRLELLRHHKGLHIRVVRVGCIRLLCPAEVVRFYLPAGGRALTEISGPALRTGEEVIYRGARYTVASVSGAVFTMSAGGQVLVSRGVPVHD